MPRAPQSMALLAGRPRAKRRVFSSRMVAGAVDAVQQGDNRRVRRGAPAPAYAAAARMVRVPDEGVGAVQRQGGRGGGGDAVQRIGDAAQGGVQRVIVRGGHGGRLTVGGRKLWSARFYRKRFYRNPEPRPACPL